jgi:hypothetical protein
LVLWNEVEPVLRATYGLLADPERRSVEAEEIAAALGRPADDAALCSALRDLRKYGYIDGIMPGGMASAPQDIRATEKGLQAASGWPSDGESRTFPSEFIKALTERINDDETADDERGKLRKLRDASEEVGVRVIAEVVARMAEHKGL